MAFETVTSKDRFLGSSRRGMSKRVSHKKRENMGRGELYCVLQQEEIRA